MPRKKTVDSTKLIKAVESGLPAKEIMSKFGLKTSAQLKALYLDALAEKGRVPGIVSRRPRKKAVAEKSMQIKVNKRGSLVLPRKMIEELGFVVGDTFTVRKSKVGVALKKV